MRKWICVSLLLSMAGISEGQVRDTEHREMGWLAWFGQIRFTDRSGLWLDPQLRMNDFVDEVQTFLPRVGYTYFLSEKTRLIAGHAFPVVFGAGNAPNTYEHRPWQQIQWSDTRSWFSMMQWIRLEQRFIKTPGSEYDFRGQRVRHNMVFTIPLKGRTLGDEIPYLVASNEIFVNVGRQYSRYFDQDRAFAGLGYQFSKAFNVQAGYLFVIQEREGSPSFIHTNAFRVAVFSNVDLRKDVE